MKNISSFVRNRLSSFKKKIRLCLFNSNSDTQKIDETQDRSVLFAKRALTCNPHFPVFTVGTGRCGTHFFGELFKHDGLYLANHADEIYPDADSFHRYCAFHKLPVDNGGLLWSRKCLMEMAENENKLYFESNAMLSLHAKYLNRNLSATVLLIVRSPLGFIPSASAQGLYNRSHVIEDFSLCAGFQYNVNRTNHNFSALIPRGKNYAWWRNLTDVGKTAWLWKTINNSVLKQFEELPEDKKRIIRIEDFNYEQYMQLGNIIKISPITQSIFEEVREKKPGKTGNLRPLRPATEWTDLERTEVLDIVGNTAARLGYDL